MTWDWAAQGDPKDMVGPVARFLAKAILTGGGYVDASALDVGEAIGYPVPRGDDKRYSNVMAAINIACTRYGIQKRSRGPIGRRYSMPAQAAMAALAQLGDALHGVPVDTEMSIACPHCGKSVMFHITIGPVAVGSVAQGEDGTA